jgi:hypothetical protein
MKAKQHSGVRRMPVPSKVCAPYITRSEKRKDRAEKKLFKFLLAYSKPSRAERKQYELVTGRKAPKPLTEKEREAWAKKAFAQIKGRGLGELEMFIITDLYEEWLPAGWPEAKKKRERENLKKANEAKRQKAELERQREKQRMQEEKRLEKERINRALENLDKPPRQVRYYI